MPTPPTKPATLEESHSSSVSLAGPAGTEGSSSLSFPRSGEGEQPPSTPASGGSNNTVGYPDQFEVEAELP